MQINSRILSETCEVWLFHHGGFISLDSTANFQTYQIWLSLFVRQIQEYVIKHLHFNEFFHAHGSVIGNLYVISKFNYLQENYRCFWSLLKLISGDSSYIALDDETEIIGSLLINE